MSNTVPTNNKMFTIAQVNLAALIWYGKDDLNYACLAENRLKKGEKPPKLKDRKR